MLLRPWMQGWSHEREQRGSMEHACAVLARYVEALDTSAAILGTSDQPVGVAYSIYSPDRGQQSLLDAAVSPSVEQTTGKQGVPVLERWRARALDSSAPAAFGVQNTPPFCAAAANANIEFLSSTKYSAFNTAPAVLPLARGAKENPPETVGGHGRSP
jgi:hypothetical protein